MNDRSVTPPPASSGLVRNHVNVIEGRLDGRGLRVGVVVARWNAFVTERLVEGAVDTLLRAGVAPADVTVVRVAGSWELVGAAAELVDRGDVDAIVPIGCLIKGDTIHFDLIASEVAKGLGALAREASVAVSFGVITTDTLEQAIDRAGGKHGNKGAEAAAAALEQVSVLRAIQGIGGSSDDEGTTPVASAPRASANASKTKSKRASAATSAPAAKTRRSAAR